MKSPVNIKEKAYEKQNRKMRSEYTSETGKKLGKRLTKGTNKRRPTKKAMALKKWGFGSVEAARNFCQKNKSKKS
jgi:hypothetical protein